MDIAGCTWCSCVNGVFVLICPPESVREEIFVAASVPLSFERHRGSDGDVFPADRSSTDDWVSKL